MLFRSISKHVKDQNWFAVALDFFIVVAGILIAFQITNWNEGRQEARAEDALKIRLLNEFTSLESLLEDRLIRAERIVTNTSTLIELIRTDGDLEDQPDAKTMLLDTFKFNAPIPHPTALSEAVQSGSIGRIRDEKLRTLLNEYQLSTRWFEAVEGPSSPQIDPDSKLTQAVSLLSGVKSPTLEVIDYNWDILVQAENELSVVQRKQTLQAESYRMELKSVKNVLEELEKQ